MKAGRHTSIRKTRVEYRYTKNGTPFGVQVLLVAENCKNTWRARAGCVPPDPITWTLLTLGHDASSFHIRRMPVVNALKRHLRWLGILEEVWQARLSRLSTECPCAGRWKPHQWVQYL